MRIGIFGGTFDPPHVGHQILADEAVAQLNLDRLLWVLTPDPPHKQEQMITGLDCRLEMVKAATANNSAFELSRVDIDRHGPHYAVDTVQIINKQFPSAELFYIIGGDSLHDLPSWYHPQQLLAEVDGLAVMHRPGDQIDLRLLEEKLPGIGAKIRYIDAPLLEISSRQIRERISHGEGYRYYLPPAVLSIIQRENLYHFLSVAPLE
jgi:nicotinate-nucleotide adenylyltransferase